MKNKLFSLPFIVLFTYQLDSADTQELQLGFIYNNNFLFYEKDSAYTDNHIDNKQCIQQKKLDDINEGLEFIKLLLEQKIEQLKDDE